MTQFPSVWDDLGAILKAGTQIGAAAIRDALARYLAFLVRSLSRLLGAGVLVAVFLLALASTTGGPEWLFTAGTLVIGFLGTAGLVLAIPLLWVVATAQDVPVIGTQVRRVLSWGTAAAFFSIVFAIATQVLSLWQSPSQFLLLALLVVAAVAGSQIGLFLLPRKLVAFAITIGLLTLIAFTIGGLAFPNAIGRLREAIGPMAPSPRALVINPEAEVLFLHPDSRTPIPWDRVWFIERPDGSFELFDRGGSDPRTGDPLKALDTREERAAILAWLETLRAKEQMRRREVQASAEASKDAALRLEAAARDREVAERERGEAERKRGEAERQRAEVERLRSRYLTTSSSGPHRAALVVSAGHVDRVLSERLGAAAGARTEVLSDAFVSDGPFGDAMKGNYSRLRAAEIDRAISILVLGDAHANAESSIVAGERVFKGAARIDVVVLRPGAGYATDSFSAEGTGVGFSSDAAERDALDRAASIAASRLVAYR